MPSHNHTGNAASANLIGTAEQVYLWESKVTGIISNTYIGKAPAGNNNGTTERLTINATHNHTVTINNNGDGYAHNNIQPYLSVYIWHRTA